MTFEEWITINKQRQVSKKLFVVFMMFTLLVPAFGAVAQADFDTGSIRVNQIGYWPDADKIATISTPSTSTAPLSWKLLDYYNNTVLQGMTTVYGPDSASGDFVHKANFSAFKGLGTDYKLWVDTIGTSVTFDISTNLYPSLPNHAMEYFYQHRMGTDILASYLSNPAYAHTALHPGDSAVRCFKAPSASAPWCPDTANVQKSWADAGDFGIYPVNHAISAWTLLNLFERYPGQFPDGSLNIPEKANGVPDILDEVNYGSTFLKGMLPASATLLASHKVTNADWGNGFNATTANFVATENNTVAGENATDLANKRRFLQPPSTASTYAVARTYAQLARTLKNYSPTSALASQYWAVAKDAWNRAETLPVTYYTPTTVDSVGGGDYDDIKITDDRYAAAAEMYLTAHQYADTNKPAYKTAVTTSPLYKSIGEFNWQEVAATGTLSLISAANDLPAADIAAMKASVTSFANTVVSTLNSEGYPALISAAGLKYPWGSNSFIVNRMMYLAYAADINPTNLTYLKAMNSGMDYLMGNNAMKLSYITGYGEFSESDTHDRWAWVASGKTANTQPYPKGWLSGGPNNDVINDTATPTGKAPAKSYALKNTAPNAWASKENTINWNAPLVWVAKYINDNQMKLSAGFNLTASNGPSGAVVLSWPSQGTGYTYDVYVQTPGSASLTLHSNVGAATTASLFVPAFQTSYFKVVAKHTNPALNKDSIIIQAAGFPSPGVPYVSATAGSKSIALSIVTDSGPATVYRSENNVNFVALDYAYNSSYVDYNVIPGKTYYYKVSVTAGKYGSTESAVVSAKTAALQTFFGTSFESGQTPTTWSDAVEASQNMSGYLPNIQPENSIRSNEVAKTGTVSLMFSAKDNSATASFVKFKTFDVNIPINNPNMRLSYWFYPQNELSRNVAIDFVMTDGTTMSDTWSVYTTQGANMHPSDKKGAVNAWSQIETFFAPALSGKTIDRIIVYYNDQAMYAGSTGQVRGYIDDIQITN